MYVSSNAESYKTIRHAEYPLSRQPLFLNNPSLANANQSRSAPVQRPGNNNQHQKSSKQCRYIHYRLVPPSSPQAFHKEQEQERNAIPRLDDHTRRKILAPGDSDSSWCMEIREAQWLNMDVRDMDATALGRYVGILS
jgi:hypothetical protein